MKKLILIALVAIMFTSCDPYIPIGKMDKSNREFPWIVISIDRAPSKEYDIRLYCEYNISTGHDRVSIEDEIIIIDTIGKYKIGDTIMLISKKY